MGLKSKRKIVRISFFNLPSFPGIQFISWNEDQIEAQGKSEVKDSMLSISPEKFLPAHDAIFFSFVDYHFFFFITDFAADFPLSPRRLEARKTEFRL